MIIGLGIDLVEINRVEKIIKRWEDVFINRLFTQQEIEYCENKNNNKFQSYAGKFAAKEAFLKALGWGLWKIEWKEIEILNDNKGRPFIRISERIKEIFSQKKIYNHLVSITHTKDYVIAEVLLETR
ncbi:MAG: holo-[acyl-carrier-protein] synthase [Candidatus Caldatribacteriota bacterium]